MKTAPPSNQTEQDAKAGADSGNPATTSSDKPSSGQHPANHAKAGQNEGAGGGAKQQHPSK